MWELQPRFPLLPSPPPLPILPPRILQSRVSVAPWWPGSFSRPPTQSLPHCAPTFGPSTPSYTVALGDQAQLSALPDLSTDLPTLLDSVVRSHGPAHGLLGLPASSSPAPTHTSVFTHQDFSSNLHPSSLPSVTYQTASVPFICEAHWHKFHVPQTQEPMPPPTQILGPSSGHLSPKWWFISRFSDHCTGD